MRKISDDTTKLYVPISREMRDRFEAKVGKRGLAARVRELIAADLAMTTTTSKPRKRNGRADVGAQA